MSISKILPIRCTIRVEIMNDLKTVHLDWNGELKKIIFSLASQMCIQNMDNLVNYLYGHLFSWYEGLTVVVSEPIKFKYIMINNDIVRSKIQWYADHALRLATTTFIENLYSLRAKELFMIQLLINLWCIMSNAMITCYHNL